MDLSSGYVPGAQRAARRISIASPLRSTTITASSAASAQPAADFLLSSKQQLQERAKDLITVAAVLPRFAIVSSGASEELAKVSRQTASLDPALEHTQASLERIKQGLAEMKARSVEIKRGLQLSVQDVSELLKL